MGEKLVIGPINKGLRNDRTPFIIDNDSFPTLLNAFQWRGRIRRKRGTQSLGRLNRYFTSGSATITLSATGVGNLITGFDLEATGAILPGNLQTVSITDTTASVTYTDTTGTGILSPAGTAPNLNTIDYSTGVVTILAAASHTITATFYYYPNLPVMGLEQFAIEGQQFPETLGFDTTYSYEISNNSPYPIFDVSFFKNPPTPGTKTTWTPLTWAGHDYQQFWTTNFAGALWATNGNQTSAGMQVQQPTQAVQLTATTVRFDIANSPAVVGDYIFVNEWTGGGTPNTLNFQTGYVSAVNPATSITVTFPNASVAAGTYTAGMVQYLTNIVSDSYDGIRWYDGDPTDGGTYPPSTSLGWVNYAPPLSLSTFSIDTTPSKQYYLVGATMIYPYRDFLLFIGPYIQTTAGQVAGSPALWLQDTVIFSQNGTPYYTCSFTQGSPPFGITTQYNPLIVPAGQTATASAMWEDVTGYGGYITSGVSQPILTLVPNEDVLILGYPQVFTRLIYTGNNLIPFLFYRINSELGSGSTFSAVTFDKGSFTLGNFGVVMATQVAAQRVDLQIPDQAFQINYSNNGPQRVCAARNYIQEWVYITYPSADVQWSFPNQTLMYNYRDDSWAILNECYTTYGTFRKQTGQTWATIGEVYPSWEVWNDAWESGASTLFMPEVIAGNQQGFVLIRDVGTGEGVSGYIQSFLSPMTITSASNANPCVLGGESDFVPGVHVMITGVVGMTQLNGNIYTVTAVTPTTISLNVDSTGFTAYANGGQANPTGNAYSPNHCLNSSDPISGAGNYIQISGATGTIASTVNGKIFQVQAIDADTLQLSPSPIPAGAFTQYGNAQFTRFYVPFIQSKQFPTSWDMGRKTRLGPQQFLFTSTANGQLIVNLYLSQDGGNPYNDPLYNNAMVYNQIMFTCPESTNLGLTQANVNLQELNQVSPTTGASENSQAQIWHRFNPSLLGDTVQVGITLSQDQMLDPTLSNQTAEIELHAIILDVSPSGYLS